MKKCCKTCQHYSIIPRDDGKKIARRHSIHPCTFPPIQIALPDSARKNVWGANRINERAWMSPQDGTECPCWTKRQP